MPHRNPPSAHTPSPWRIEDIRNDYSGHTVARIGMLRIVADSRTADNEEANAALIVAAPELLQRLIELVTDLKGAKELMLSAAESDSWMLTADGWDSLIDGTNAVIAKAEGRTY